MGAICTELTHDLSSKAHHGHLELNFLQAIVMWVFFVTLMVFQEIALLAFQRAADLDVLGWKWHKNYNLRSYDGYKQNSGKLQN